MPMQALRPGKSETLLWREWLSGVVALGSSVGLNRCRVCLQLQWSEAPRVLALQQEMDPLVEKFFSRNFLKEIHIKRVTLDQIS